MRAFVSLSLSLVFPNSLLLASMLIFFLKLFFALCFPLHLQISRYLRSHMCPLTHVAGVPDDVKMLQLALLIRTQRAKVAAQMPEAGPLLVHCRSVASSSVLLCMHAMFLRS